MPNESTVSKWGNSLAVRIPLAIAKQASLGEGDCVALTLDGAGGIVLRPTRRKYALSDLVGRITRGEPSRPSRLGTASG